MNFVSEYRSDPNCRPEDWGVSDMSKEEHLEFLKLVKNPPTEPDKTQGISHVPDLLLENELKSISDVKKASEAFHDLVDAIENAQIVEKTPAEKMEEILRNNDKFETIKVIMELLCKELGLPISALMKEIVMGLQRVTEDYYKSMEEWKKLTKKPVNNDIRQ